MTPRARLARRAAIAAWLALAAVVASWPLAGIGRISALVAGLPLLLPLPGLLRGRRRAAQAAPMALAPVLALSIAECLVNPPARIAAAAALALAFGAFAAILAWLRTQPPD